MKLRVYIMPNYDGTNRVAVAAGDLKTAAVAIGASVYAMRQMGWHPPREGKDDDVKALALASPGTPFYRPIDAREAAEDAHPWSPRRWLRAGGRTWRHSDLAET